MKRKMKKDSIIERAHFVASAHSYSVNHDLTEYETAAKWILLAVKGQMRAL